MFLKKVKITNFRKFNSEDNEIEFIESTLVKEESAEINIAPNTTLIVGKNNSGKTTITVALEKIINGKHFEVNDFNYHFLFNLLEEYEKSLEVKQRPFLEFTFTIGIFEKSKDLVTNVAQFLNLSKIDDSELIIRFRYELKDDIQFLKELKDFIALELKDSQNKYKKFLELIRNSDFVLNCYNTKDEKVNFHISKLIELKVIKANNVKNDSALTEAFSKIIKYRYDSILKKDEIKTLRDKVDDINSTMTTAISEHHTDGINEIISAIESSDKLEIYLSSDITIDNLMNSLIRYEYVESSHHIPESQFGLGYTNLMTVLAELIGYIEKYHDNAFNSKINLILIEEPETFMHPQMQELFIKHINDAISSLLKLKNKNVNSQLMITTHSAHILNSKIHTGNTFDNINYITTKNKYSKVISLNDKKIKADSDEKDMNFIKKHIKFKVSELFFSDAVIFVEGITEETILSYTIDGDEDLNKYYISIFNINGAHGLVYHNLIRELNVPCLVITDLDILRSDSDKTSFIQITDLKDRKTTNKTLIKYHGKETIDDIENKFENGNLYISFQTKIEEYFPTSFEEAYILTNYQNDLFNNVLETVKPKIYKDIVGEDNKDLLKESSYKLQRKLTKSKSNFANELLYQLVNIDEGKSIPKIPEYIGNGLKWLKKSLEGTE